MLVLSRSVAARTFKLGISQLVRFAFLHSFCGRRDASVRSQHNGQEQAV
jgi:hypothetical protein